MSAERLHCAVMHTSITTWIYIVINIGFNFTTSDFRYCVLEKVGNDVTLLDKNKIGYPKALDVTNMSGWLETQIFLLLDKHSPNQVGYKLPLVLKSTKSIQNSLFPLGVLNLCCHKRNITASHFNSQGINATKFGLAKKDDVYKYVDDNLGKYPPYWDKPTKDAALVAWFLL
jgi:Holliday junction resolvasome RuvABC endonuclease subunit